MPSVDNGREIISTTLTAQVHAIESMIHQTLPLFIQIFADVYDSSVLFALPLAIPIRISHLYHAAALDHAPYVVTLGTSHVLQTLIPMATYTRIRVIACSLIILNG